jgi:hypothetical protein
MFINPLLGFAGPLPSFTIEFFIDTFQNVKRGLTDDIISDPVLNRAAHGYIDSQTAFAKMLIKNTKDITKYSVDTYSQLWFPKKSN